MIEEKVICPMASPMTPNTILANCDCFQRDLDAASPKAKPHDARPSNILGSVLSTKAFFSILSMELVSKHDMLRDSEAVFIKQELLLWRVRTRMGGISGMTSKSPYGYKTTIRH